MIRLLCSILCFMLLFTAKSYAENISNKNTIPEWSIYIYLCGSDLESSFGSASAVLRDISSVTLPFGVEYYIQTGGSYLWENTDISGYHIERYHYTSNRLTKIAQLPDQNMGSGDTLSDFLKFSASHKSKHKAIILWNHGAGTLGGIAFDEKYKTMIDLNQLQEAFQSTYTANPKKPPFDIIGFDACLMSTIDVANSIYGFGKYMIASQEVEPENGFEYRSISQKLADNPSITPLDLGKAICDTYYSDTKKRGIHDLLTMSIIDLSKMPQLNYAYNRLGSEMLHQSEINSDYILNLSRAVYEADNYGSNTAIGGYSDMIDLVDLVISNDTLFLKYGKQFTQALSDAVIYNVKGNYRHKASGLSAYYPLSCDNNSLSKFSTLHMIHPIYTELYKKLLKNDYIIDSHDFNALNKTALSIDNSGNASITFSQDFLPLINFVSYSLLRYDKENNRFVLMGTDNYIDKDWTTGTFTAKYNGNWGALDGHPLYVILDESTNDYNIYAVPLKVNGNNVFMKVGFDRKTQQNHILGYRPETDSQSYAVRKLAQFKPGDTITTIMYTIAPGGKVSDMQPIDCDTFVFTEQSHIEDCLIEDGIYAYMFKFTSPNGQSAYSNAILFKNDSGTQSPCDMDGNII